MGRGVMVARRWAWTAVAVWVGLPGVSSASEPGGLRVMSLPTGGAAVVLPADLPFPPASARLLIHSLDPDVHADALVTGEGLFHRRGARPAWDWVRVDAQVWLEPNRRTGPVWLIAGPGLPPTGTLEVLPPLNETLPDGHDLPPVGYDLVAAELWVPGETAALPVNPDLVRGAGDSLTTRINRALHDRDWMIEELAWEPRWRPSPTLPAFPLHMTVTDPETGEQATLAEGTVSTAGDAIRWTTTALGLTWDWIFHTDGDPRHFPVVGLVYGAMSRTVNLEVTVDAPHGFVPVAPGREAHRLGAPWQAMITTNHLVVLAHDVQAPRVVAAASPPDRRAMTLRYTLHLGDGDATYPGQASWRFLLFHDRMEGDQGFRETLARIPRMYAWPPQSRHEARWVDTWARGWLGTATPAGPVARLARHAVIELPAGLQGASPDAIGDDFAVIDARALAWLRIVAASAVHPRRFLASAALHAGVMTFQADLIVYRHAPEGMVSIPLNLDPLLHRGDPAAANAARRMAERLTPETGYVVIDALPAPGVDGQPASGQAMGDALVVDPETARVGCLTDSGWTLFLRAVAAWADDRDVPVAVMNADAGDWASQATADAFLLSSRLDSLTLAEELARVGYQRIAAGRRVVGYDAKHPRGLDVALFWGLLPGLLSEVDPDHPVPDMAPWLQRMAERGWRAEGPVRARRSGIQLEHFGWQDGESDGLISLWNPAAEAVDVVLDPPEGFTGWALHPSTGAVDPLDASVGLTSVRRTLAPREVAVIQFVSRDHLAAEHAAYRVMPWSSLKRDHFLVHLDSVQQDDLASVVIAWSPAPALPHVPAAAPLQIINAGNSDLILRSLRLRHDRSTQRLAVPRDPLAPGSSYRMDVPLPPAGAAPGVVTLEYRLERDGQPFQGERRLIF